MREKIIIKTRQFAKKQEKWFDKEPINLTVDMGHMNSQLISNILHCLMKDITYVYLLIIIIYITYFTMYENEYETKLKRDIDDFDHYFDHILVFDNSIKGSTDKKVIGTY